MQSVSASHKKLIARVLDIFVILDCALFKEKVILLMYIIL